MRLCAPVDQRYKAANPDCDTIDYGCLRSLMEHAIQLYLESSIALVLGKTVLAIATSQTFFLISRLSCRGLEAKHLMPAKSSPRSELAMAIVKWRLLAPEFCSPGHTCRNQMQTTKYSWKTISGPSVTPSSPLVSGQSYWFVFEGMWAHTWPNPFDRGCSRGAEKRLEGRGSSPKDVPSSLRWEGKGLWSRAWICCQVNEFRNSLGTDVDNRAMRRMVWLLKSSSELKTRGREELMQAVGHFDEKLSNKNRNLIKESMFKKNVLCIDSPWYDQGLDPPPASIGNTFIWRRPKICPVAPVAAAKGHFRRFSATE